MNATGRRVEGPEQTSAGKPLQANDLYRQPGAIMQIGCALMSSGEQAKAVRFVEKLVAEHPNDPDVLSAARMVLSEGIPNYHESMLADGERNAAFERAIVRAVSSRSTVLDIGSGSGLLAMIAARAGAAHVYACEANPAIAQTARRIVAANGLSDRISVIDKHSTDLDPDKDFAAAPDIIVSEVFSANLIGEGALATIGHAREKLAKPGAQIIPASGAIRVALAHYDRPAADLSAVQGFDLSDFERHLSPAWLVATESRRLQLRGPAETLFEFDFRNRAQFMNSGTTMRLEADGPANGVVQWIRLQLDAEVAYENVPGRGERSAWNALFSPLPSQIGAGDSVNLHAAHDRLRLQLWFT